MMPIPDGELIRRLLTAALASGAEFRRHNVHRLDVHPTHVDVDGVLEAAVVIGADGNVSMTRNRAYFYEYIRGNVAEISIKDAQHEDGGQHHRPGVPVLGGQVPGRAAPERRLPARAERRRISAR